ncbi:MAG: 3-phosphoshikimate 1-carboxyvinyltransferase [Clostridia bacterium]|nr:3-phosphoshikimate 1-carboxyvinyltransferase [Clostridia bacterium]
MNAIITPKRLSGDITVPSSKSASHRAIICAALAKGKSRIKGVSLSDDILATLGAIKALGASVETDGDDYIITGITEPKKSANVDCGESGSTLRFFIPIAAALGVSTVFEGHGRLIERPLSAITNLLGENGIICRYTSNVNLPLEISGKLGEGRFVISGSVSSQYITGLLFALAYIGKEAEIVISSPLESAGYVDMTVDTLSQFGAKIEKTECGYLVHPSVLTATDITVEGDWSQAAFFLAAAALGGEIRIHGLNKNSLQGDRDCERIFREIGTKIEWKDGVLYAEKGELMPVSIDASQIPDIIPPIAAVLGQCEGRSTISNAYRLRIKESDRLSAIARGLVMNGISVVEGRDILVIDGERLKGGNIDGFADHRIVMAFSIAAAYAENESIISCAEAVNKSYPKFFEDFASIGGAVNVI